MKVTINWLKRYVDFDWTPAQLAERLTMLGLEVEGMQTIPGEFEGIVVGHVLSRDKVPGSDKLSVCRVHDGRGERQVICGAQNFDAGAKVPLILPGASLPLKPGETKPFTIAVRKVLGVESHGMLCSPQELGLPDSVDGLLLLPADAKVGQPFAEYLGRTGGDVVLDLEVTPNRPDLNSVIGIAREIAAVTGNDLRLPAEGVSIFPPVAGASAAELVSVRLEAADVCPRYTARVLRGVRIEPSPDWLRVSLERVGLRSINNVVDVTNFVMLETGQPLHAFDYHLVAKGTDGKPTIVVRRATDGERFVTLDGREHVLNPDHLLIADSEKGIALAGVMGGQNTEIQNSTMDVLLESAWFAPTSIRRTSKSLGLRTDASYRFERGADVGVAEWASRRAAALILQTAGGSVATGVVDAYPQPAHSRQITLRHHRVNEVLGTQLHPDEIENFLRALSLHPVEHNADAPVGVEASSSVTVRIPSYRVDLKREVDLIEEVARLYGVDKIPSSSPRGMMGAHEFDAVFDQFAAVRRLLTGVGLHEAQGQTLINDGSAKRVDAAPVLLANPLSADMNALRPSLLPGLLDSLRHNLSRRSSDVSLFEIGRVFRSVNGRTVEGWRVGMAMTGARNPVFWSGADRDAKCDHSDLKGIVEELLEHFGLRGVVFQRRPEPTELFIESASVALGGKVVLGELGQLQPGIARQQDLRDPVFLAEFDLDQLLNRRNSGRTYKPLPEQPSVRRDVAMVVPETVTHDDVLALVKRSKTANLESVELFDVFRGKLIPDAQKSLAYAFTYRATDRTLTDAEVTSAHGKLVEAFKQTLKASIRE